MRYCLSLDLKDAFHSLRLTENSKKYCGILPYFGSTSYLYQRMPMGLNISPVVWQSYINAILNCLSSKKYCEAIMDDLLLFMPNKQTHFEKLIDCIAGIMQEWTENIPKEVSVVQNRIAIYGKYNFYKREKSVCETIEE